MNDETLLINEQELYNDVSKIIDSTTARIIQKISEAGVILYWRIGRRINQVILNYDRAEYGKKVIVSLADKLQKKYGRGYSRSVIYRCVQFSEQFQDEKIVINLASHLKWTHIIRLLSIDDKVKREFYAEMCRINQWSTRLLNSKIESLLFERTAIAKKPEALIEKELIKLRDTNSLQPDFIVQDPLIFDYLTNSDMESEKSFEDAIIRDIEEFLLSMGSGFTFQERQKVIEVDGCFYKMDLLMYNRSLRCLVVVELKKGKFRAEHKGQIELYLRWLEKYEMSEGENPPMGIVLCTEKSESHVELLQLEKSGIRVSEVIHQLPPKTLFQERLNKAIQRAREIYEPA